MIRSDPLFFLIVLYVTIVVPFLTIRGVDSQAASSDSGGEEESG